MFWVFILERNHKEELRMKKLSLVEPLWKACENLIPRRALRCSSSRGRASAFWWQHANQTDSRAKALALSPQGVRAPRVMPPPTLRAWVFFQAVCLAGYLIVVPPVLNQPGAISAAASQDVPGSAIHMTIHQGLLTVNVRDVPLADLLRVIGKQAALRVAIYGAGNTSVTDSFADLPLDHGITRLVRVDGLVLIYTASAEARGTSVLTEVWVYEAGPGKRLVTRIDATVEPQQEEQVSETRRKQIRAARIKAVWKLVANRDQTAAATLAQILAQQDEDPIVRAQAADALAKVGGAEATAALSAAVGDQNPVVRIQAIRAFGKVEGDRAVQTLSRVLMGDPDPQVRRHAAPALAMLRTLEARWALEAAISDPDPSVSEAAAAALRRWEKRAVATYDGTYYGGTSDTY